MATTNMKTITLTNEHLCAHVVQLKPVYVSFSGHIIGVSDHTYLQGDAEALQRGADEVKFDSK